MDESKIDRRILEQLKKLEIKYEAMGQDLSSYLDGLLHADYLTYWDYIHLDTLLSLQNTRTPFPDEKIFVIYHQITELYFKLIIHEMQQITEITHPASDLFEKRLKRINRYFKHLVDSFDVMVDGMDQEQFLNFRMSLLPASGFQSAQYREIEFRSTPVFNLTKPGNTGTHDIEALYQQIYWKSGATELSSGKKTLTLRQFEEKYSDQFLDLIQELQGVTIAELFQKHYDGHDAIIDLLRKLDSLANVAWPLAHYKSAVRYLQGDPEILEATGGTNWQKYLPPRFQRISFFPELWSAKEKQEWGKGWVLKTLEEQNS